MLSSHLFLVNKALGYETESISALNYLPELPCHNEWRFAQQESHEIRFMLKQQLQH